jgi:hypothetical protein
MLTDEISAALRRRERSTQREVVVTRLCRLDRVGARRTRTSSVGEMAEGPTTVLWAFARGEGVRSGCALVSWARRAAAACRPGKAKLARQRHRAPLLLDLARVPCPVPSLLPAPL